MCVPGERRSVPGTKAQNFVLLGARKTTVNGGAPGAGDDAGVLVLEEEEREEDEGEMEVDDGASPPISPTVI